MAMSAPSGSQQPALAGKRIVITRPDADAARLATRLRMLGATPIVAPAIRIEFTDPPELDAALGTLDAFDWIVFTSKNGVAAVMRRTDSIAGPKVAAIGPATATALVENGVEPDIIPEVYISEGIVDALGDVRGAKILLPRADIARRALADELRNRGAQVHEIAAYHTRTVGKNPPDLEAADAVTFTSSSTVLGFLETGSVPARAKVICIGPITAATARAHGLRVDGVADEYTEDGLVRALVAAFSYREPEHGRTDG